MDGASLLLCHHEGILMAFYCLLIRYLSDIFRGKYEVEKLSGTWKTFTELET